jgi:hypothetical protein
LFSSIRVLLLTLVAVATVGCGDTQDQFVFTGTTGPGPGPGVETGTLTFTNLNNLPADVEELVFDFFTGVNATGNNVFRATSAFAATVSVVNVPGESNSVLITGYNGDGEPVASIVAPVVVSVGDNSVVDLSTATVTVITLDGLVLSPATATIGVGETQQYTASGSFSNGETRANLQGVTFAVTGPATIAQNGLATGTGDGTATVTATRGSESDTATLEVEAPVGPDPQLTLDATILEYERDSAAVALSPGATFTDTVANLDGGTLIITATGNTTGLALDAPGAPDIGTVTGDGTDEITVAFDEGATPAAIEQFLRAVTISTSGGTATFGPRTVTVTLTDPQNNTTSGARTVNVQGSAASTITVGPQGADFTSIQAAINSVAALPDGSGAGSRITVAAGDYSAEDVIVVSDNASLAGLQLIGANAGVSAGSTPGIRAAESIVEALTVDNQVIIDGFEITGLFQASPGLELGVYFDDGSAGSVLRNSDIDRSEPTQGSARGVLGALGVDNLTIENNNFTGWLGGTYLQGTNVLASTGHVISGNRFNDNGVGSSNDFVGDTQYRDNVYGVTTLGEHIGVLTPGTGFVVEGNDLASTGAINLFDGAATTVGAENNWWGQATGPLVTQTSAAQGGTIDTDPFLTSDPFPTQP